MLLLGWISRSWGISGIYVAGGAFVLVCGVWLLSVRGPFATDST
jgi:hypothetical protein